MKNENFIIYLRKLRLNEAELKLKKELDELYLKGVKKVKIVHGKGSGKLLNMAHKFLQSQFYVESFRIGEFYEGGTGVTIVKLK